MGQVQFLALIPLMWLFLSWLLARLSGWSTLAQRYPATAAMEGESAHMRTGRLGAINYHSCLSFCVNDAGLRIAVAFPLRLGHRPLFIPWEEFHNVADEGKLYSHKVNASVGRPTLVRMTLPGWVRYRMPMDMRPESP